MTDKKDTISEDDYLIELPPHQPTPAGFYETESHIEYQCPHTVRYYIFKDLLDFYRKNDSSFDNTDMNKILSDFDRWEKKLIKDETQKP